MVITSESMTEVGAAIGLSISLVGRRQSGTTAWTVPELGRLADHWGIPVMCLFAGPEHVRQAILQKEPVAQAG
jgi:hypothetical protein